MVEARPPKGGEPTVSRRDCRKCVLCSASAVGVCAFCVSLCMIQLGGCWHAIVGQIPTSLCYMHGPPIPARIAYSHGSDLVLLSADLW